MEGKGKNPAELKSQNRIKELRGGLTQEEFMKKLVDNNIYISNKTLSMYENGKVFLSPEFALKVAKAFDVTLDWLYGFDVKASSSVIEKIERILKIYPSTIWHEDDIDREYPIEAFYISIDSQFLRLSEDIKALENKREERSSKRIKKNPSELEAESRISHKFNELRDAIKKEYYDKIWGNEFSSEKRHMTTLIAVYDTPETSEKILMERDELLSNLSKVYNKSQERKRNAKGKKQKEQARENKE